MASVNSNDPVPICRERVGSIERQHDSSFFVLANDRKILVSAVLASHIRVGDEIAFPLPAGSATGPEICVAKAHSPIDRCLYQAPIGYVTQPKLDRRQRHFVCGQVKHGHLGISAILLPCELLREYFYRLPQPDAQARHSSLYELLGISSRAAPAELRLAFKLRQLELASTGAARGAQATVERAFNILGHPELRTCYDALLADPEVPAIFPYGGFGLLVVIGARTRDGQTFFAH